MQANRAIRLVLGTLLTGLALCPSARAAFPGANGRIVVGQGADARNPSGGSDFVRSYSRTGRANTLLSCSGTPFASCPGALDPAYSPDGERIVYDTRDGLAVMDADGSNVGLLPRTGHQPAWSPDGRWVVFSREPSPGAAPEIFRARTDGRGLKRLTVGGGEAPAWSVRGRIAYQRCERPNSGRCVLRVVRPSGRGDRPILTNAGDPSWSPDGRRLAVERTTRAGPTVWTLDAGGGDLERLTAGYTPAWSPDGRRIAFLSNTPDDFEQTLATVPAGGGEPEVVATDPGFDSGFTSGPDWQPRPRRR